MAGQTGSGRRSLNGGRTASGGPPRHAWAWRARGWARASAGSAAAAEIFCAVSMSCLQSPFQQLLIVSSTLHGCCTLLCPATKPRHPGLLLTCEWPAGPPRQPPAPCDSSKALQACRGRLQAPAVAQGLPAPAAGTTNAACRADARAPALLPFPLPLQVVFSSIGSATLLLLSSATRRWVWDEPQGPRAAAW